MLRRFTRCCLTALMASVSAVPVGGQAPSRIGQVADVVVNMRDVEIADVAEQISRITGRTLILDPVVRGTVNVTSAEPLSVAGVWDLFQSVLRVHGFAAVRSGKAWRIVPQASAVRDGGARGRVGAQDVVTRLIRLRNLSPDVAARVFRPLVASFGDVQALTSPNAIVVTDYAENVRRIESLSRSLDSGSGAKFDSIVLRNASARDAAPALQAVLGDNVKVAADERSNVLLIRGDATGIAQARRAALLLDKPGGAAPITRMFRLSNADAESVTEILRGLVGGQSSATNPVARSLAGGSASRRGAGPMDRSGAGGGVGSGSIFASPPVGANEEGIVDLRASAAPPPSAGGFAVDGLAIQPAPELNAIVVRGAPSQIASIEPLIAELDVRRPQVMIEAAIVEILGDQSEALGIQLGLGAAAVDSADGVSSSFNNLGLPLSTVLNAIGAPAGGTVLPNGLTGNLRITNNFSVLVQALGQSTKANLLSTPSLTTLDNEPAEIVVGQNVPFRTGSFTTTGNTFNPFTTIERQDVGITLRVVPRVHSGDVVRLEVSQEVSSLTNAVSGAADLITNRRSIQTTVLADNGQTIVLGGLITDDRQNIRSKVPVLGDVPLVGELFKSRQRSAVKRTLFVFLRPTILRDRAAAAEATGTKYDRLRGAEAGLDRRDSLLLDPQTPRLTTEIEGIY